MCSDEATEKKVCMDMARIMVMVRRSFDITRTICVCINEERFRIKLKEEMFGSWRYVVRNLVVDEDYASSKDDRVSSKEWYIEEYRSLSEDGRIPELVDGNVSRNNLEILHKSTSKEVIGSRS